MSDQSLTDQSTDTPDSSAAAEPEEKSLLEVTLSGAISLAKDGKNYSQATEQFEALLAQVKKGSPESATLLKQLWKEYISVQRSAMFYESLSDAEAGLSEKMAQSNIQLKQNYMRLIQEQ